jgi:hypothetical protein
MRAGGRLSAHNGQKKLIYSLAYVKESELT